MVVTSSKELSFSNGAHDKTCFCHAQHAAVVSPTKLEMDLDDGQRLLALIDGGREEASRSAGKAKTVVVPSSILAPPANASITSTTGIGGASAFKFGHCWHCRPESGKTESVCAVCHRKSTQPPLPVPQPPLPVPTAAKPPGPVWVSHEETFGRGETSFSSLDERTATDARKRARPVMRVLGASAR